MPIYQSVNKSTFASTFNKVEDEEESEPMDLKANISGQRQLAPTNIYTEVEGLDGFVSLASLFEKHDAKVFAGIEVTKMYNMIKFNTMYNELQVFLPA